MSLAVARLFTISRLFTLRATIFTFTTRSLTANGITTITLGTTSIGAAITLGSAVPFGTTAFRTTITFRATVSIGTAIQRAIPFRSAITGTRTFAIAWRTHRATDQLKRIELSVVIGVEFIEQIRQLGQLVLRDAAVVVLVELANEHRSARSIRTTVSLGAAPFRASCLGTTIAFRAAAFWWAIPFRTTAFGTTISFTAFTVRTVAFGGAIAIRAAITFGTACIRTTVAFAAFTFRTAAFGGAITLRATFALWSSITLGTAITVRAATAFRSARRRRQVFNELFLGQRSVRVFAGAAECLRHDLLGSLGSLFHRDLAIAVRVEATEHLFGVAERRTTTFGASLIRLASTFRSTGSLGASSFRTSSFRTSSLGTATFGVLAGSAFGTTSQPFGRAGEFFLSELGLAMPFKQRSQAFSRFGGQFVLGQLAITVGIEPLEHLAGFGTLSTGASRLGHESTGRLHPFFLSQFGLAESLEDLPDPIAQRFGKLVLGELPVAVLIELLEGLFRIGPLSTGTALATRCGELCEVFGRQFGLAQAIKHRLQPLANLFGKLFQSDLAILVAIEHLEALTRITAATTFSTTGGAERNIRLLFGLVGLLELVFRQHAILVLVAETDEPLEEPSLLFGNFLFRQLAVAVFVQLGEQGVGLGNHLLCEGDRSAAQHRGQSRTVNQPRAFQHVQSSS